MMSEIMTTDEERHEQPEEDFTLAVFDPSEVNPYNAPKRFLKVEVFRCIGVLLCLGRPFGECGLAI